MSFPVRDSLNNMMREARDVLIYGVRDPLSNNGVRDVLSEDVRDTSNGVRDPLSNGVRDILNAGCLPPELG